MTLHLVKRDDVPPDVQYCRTNQADWDCFTEIPARDWDRLITAACCVAIGAVLVLLFLLGTQR